MATKQDDATPQSGKKIGVGILLFIVVTIALVWALKILLG